MKSINLSVEMENGETHALAAKIKDLNRTEEIAARLKWGTNQESPFRWLTFLAYAVMTRTGLYDVTKGFDEFQEDCAMVSDGEDEEVNPTQ